MAFFGGKLWRAVGIGAALSVALAASPGANAQAPAAPPLPEPKSVALNFLPYSEFLPMAHEAPVIKAKLGGRSYWFILDTGFATSFIKQGAATEAKLSPIDAPNIAAGSNLTSFLQSVDGKYQGVLAAKLTVGFIDFTAVPFYLASDATAGTVTDNDSSLAGVLGMNLWWQFAIYIDFAHRKIILFPHGNVDAANRAKLGFTSHSGTGAGQTITAALTPDPVNTGAYGVAMQCNQKPVRLFLDTGAQHTYLFKPIADFGVPRSAITEETSFMVDGAHQSQMAKLPLSIGGSTVPDLVVGFRAGKSDTGDGMIGSDFLSHYDVLIDYPAQKLYLRPHSDK